MWRATRLFRPETLPAPHGRGPEGWPLVACPACHQPIPWPDPPVQPRAYYLLSAFCSPACRFAWPGPKMARQKPVDFAGRMSSRAPPEPFAKPLPLRSEVERCGHCGAGRGSLRWVTVGFSCYRCGALTHVRDGDWSRESLTAVACPEDRW